MNTVTEDSSAFGRAVHLLYWGIGLEMLIWISSLIYLAIFNPYAQSEFTICPFAILGFHHCPGCGLGRAVSFLLHGDLQRSIHTHILGIPAAGMLVYRIVSLFNQSDIKKMLHKSAY